jgi:hypothetical protein
MFRFPAANARGRGSYETGPPIAPWRILSISPRRPFDSIGPYSLRQKKSTVCRERQDRATLLSCDFVLPELPSLVPYQSSYPT